MAYQKEPNIAQGLIDGIEGTRRAFKDPKNQEASRNLWKLILTIVFLIPGKMLIGMLHTGGGRFLNDLHILIAGSVILLLLAHWFQDLSGDLLFLLWGVFVAKWVAERVWLHWREAQGERIHSRDFGVPLLSAIGVHGRALPLFVFLGGGFLLTSFPETTLFGLFLACGGGAGLVFNAMWAIRARDEQIRERDSVLEAYAREAAGPAIEPDRPGFQRVDVE
ncbi:MAG: hypothetical protein ACTS3F_02600 [Phycisphaerales bacterium]